MRTNFSLLIASGLLFAYASCTTTKQIAYFQNAKDTSFPVMRDTIEVPFQKNDILDIRISSLNNTASADFNASDNSGRGYLVNNDGNVLLPVLGNIKAAGYTKTQLKKYITNTILTRQLLLDPIVEIRHQNYEVTILGEVARPAVLVVPSEQISLVKALGLAGDLTIYGKRDNVMLIREENGMRTTRTLDLTSAEFLQSPYYYLKPNDLIYVQPSKTKVAATSKSLILIPILLSSISLLLITYATFK